jgi:hypothetical protein
MIQSSQRGSQARLHVSTSAAPPVVAAGTGGGQIFQPVATALAPRDDMIHRDRLFRTEVLSALMAGKIIGSRVSYNYFRVGVIFSIVTAILSRRAIGILLPLLWPPRCQACVAHRSTYRSTADKAWPLKHS